MAHIVPVGHIVHPVHPLQWLGQRDRDLAALRRAGRAAIVMPAHVRPGRRRSSPIRQLATFAAFGSFAMLLLVDFGGPMRERLQAQAALALLGGVFVCLGTLASTDRLDRGARRWRSSRFGVIFAGVVSSVLAGATTSLLLVVHPARHASPGPLSADPRSARRLGDGGRRGAASPSRCCGRRPPRGPLRAAAISACRALAARLRARGRPPARRCRGDARR